MDMTTTAFGDATVTARTGPGDTAGTPRDVAELVRQCSRLDGRSGFRIVARGVSGHIFFERGRVIHAEFGEDCGLRAVVEMLRAGSVLVQPATSWPSQPSLHLGPDLLLSMTGKDASRVVRKVDLPVEPPPLPEPDDALHSDAREEPAAGLVAPVHPEAARPATRRAVSGVMPRIVEPPVERLAHASPGPARSRAPRLPAPPRPEPSSSGPSSSQPAWPVPRQPAELPVTRAQKARSRSIVVARAAKAAALAGDAGSTLPPPRTPIQAPCGQQPTTMVRIASRGDLLAARGENAEQLAEAAAFIHGLANLIAADFGRQGRANVHLSGHGVSLLVARSEVNDIAAALGPTERMASLLGKVGLK
jgi:hypothetical protein